MRRFRLEVVLCALFAGVVFFSLAASGATAGLLREVKVTVHNGTHKSFMVAVYEKSQVAFRYVWHRRVAKVLGSGHSLVVESGAYGQRTIAIATSQCEHHASDMHALTFFNPFIGYPEVTESVQKVTDGEVGWHPVERGTQFLHQGATHKFWDGGVHLTRHHDSAHYIEFTETIFSPRKCP